MNTDSLQLIHGDARRIPLPDDSVQCIVTSPPYWGLRKYAGEQELVWLPLDHPKGSDFPEMCPHEWTDGKTAPRITGGLSGDPTIANHQADYFVEGQKAQTCARCGAWRGAYGLEPTIEMYVAHTLEILRECRRVLRPDGVLFWNIGDSYCASPKGSMNGWDKSGLTKPTDGRDRAIKTALSGVAEVDRDFGRLKAKDLCLIPARVALAAQADGWWVRSMIIWAKPNPMPESVTDRPTDAYEHILMLTKSERYYWDADAVREPSTGGAHHPGYGDGGPKAQQREQEGTFANWRESTRERFPFRNMRNVWMFATQPYSGAHFATFPQELPRRCILAATSAKGACAQCGAPWERVLRVGGGNIGMPDLIPQRDDLARTCNRMDDGTGTYQRETIGWRPTCVCPGQHGKTAPCVVLDPFGGSGTTGRVALELRRRAVLVDIAYNAEYRELAERRTSGVNVKLPFL